jgi:hypothetical protein
VLFQQIVDAVEYCHDRCVWQWLGGSGESGLLKGLQNETRMSGIGAVLAELWVFLSIFFFFVFFFLENVAVAVDKKGVLPRQVCVWQWLGGSGDCGVLKGL